MRSHSDIYDNNFPKILVLRLKEQYKIETFIETGTFSGQTAIWASHYFESVFTIEYSRAIYERTKARHKNASNINFILGDSRQELAKLLPQLTKPAIFWLDSHWSGGDTYGKDDECPIIEEIHLINRSTCAHYILIDDARMFFAPPPLPHKPQNWPSIYNILKKIHSSNHRYYVAIVQDVIIAIPTYSKYLLIEYCQTLNTKQPSSKIKLRKDLVFVVERIIHKPIFTRVKTLIKGLIS